jgi:3-hydroxyacyl-CoA dehydrogenase / enoyl-CoA hydratase / 3-hydroxybutyryl-CoA epimerase
VIAEDTDEAESKGFGELLCTPESKGLRHLFDCITECKKETGGKKKEEGNENSTIPESKYVGMIGAGLMGGGIATVLADKEVMVRLKDIDQKGIEAALNYANKHFGKKVKRKHMSQQEYNQRMERISGNTAYSGFGMMDVVIEAVPEKLELKQKILQDVEEMSDLSNREIVFASNTSSLPITEIAKNAKYPERVLGMHFFSPVEKMPLVEVIVTEKTDPKYTEQVVKIARRMGKHVIVVNDCAGFYTTRVLAPYLTEALFLALEGYSVLEIDLAAQEAGFPVGPITLMDEVGIDVGAKVIEIMKQYYGDRMEFPNINAIDLFIKDGRLGKKVSKGFYVYKDGKSIMEDGSKVVDEEIYKKYINIPNMKKPSTRRQRAENISKRLLYSFANEAAYCLQEGVLRDSKSGDLGAVFGLGFPPFEGGPFRFMDSRGLKQVVAELRDLSEKMGKRFIPAQILVDMEMSQQNFYS